MTPRLKAALPGLAKDLLIAAAAGSAAWAAVSLGGVFATVLLQLGSFIMSLALGRWSGLDGPDWRWATRTLAVTGLLFAVAAGPVAQAMTPNEPLWLDWILGGVPAILAGLSLRRWLAIRYAPLPAAVKRRLLAANAPHDLAQKRDIRTAALASLQDDDPKQFPGHLATVPALRILAGSDPFPDTRVAALRLLGDWGASPFFRPKVREAFDALLRSDDPWVDADAVNGQLRRLDSFDRADKAARDKEAAPEIPDLAGPAADAATVETMAKARAYLETGVFRTRPQLLRRRAVENAVEALKEAIASRDEDARKVAGARLRALLRPASSFGFLPGSAHGLGGLNGVAEAGGPAPRSPLSVKRRASDNVNLGILEDPAALDGKAFDLREWRYLRFVVSEASAEKLGEPAINGASAEDSKLEFKRVTRRLEGPSGVRVLTAYSWLALGATPSGKYDVSFKNGPAFTVSVANGDASTPEERLKGFRKSVMRVFSRRDPELPFANSVSAEIRDWFPIHFGMMTRNFDEYEDYLVDDAEIDDSVRAEKLRALRELFALYHDIIEGRDPSKTRASLISRLRPRELPLIEDLLRYAAESPANGRVTVELRIDQMRHYMEAVAVLQRVSYEARDADSFLAKAAGWAAGIRLRLLMAWTLLKVFLFPPRAN